jgi:hypothetical protein
MQAGHRRPYVDCESPANIGIGNGAGAGRATPITLRLQQMSPGGQRGEAPHHDKLRDLRLIIDPGDADIEHTARSISPGMA